MADDTGEAPAATGGPPPPAEASPGAEGTPKVPLLTEVVDDDDAPPVSPPPRHSQFKGVTLYRTTGKWRAQISHGGRTVALGDYVSEEEAARVYDRAVVWKYGRRQEASFNFPMSDYKAEWDELRSISSMPTLLNRFKAERRRARDEAAKAAAAAAAVRPAAAAGPPPAATAAPPPAATAPAAAATGGGAALPDGRRTAAAAAGGRVSTALQPPAEPGQARSEAAAGGGSRSPVKGPEAAAAAPPRAKRSSPQAAPTASPKAPAAGNATGSARSPSSSGRRAACTASGADEGEAASVRGDRPTPPPVPTELPAVPTNSSMPPPKQQQPRGGVQVKEEALDADLEPGSRFGELDLDRGPGFGIPSPFSARGGRDGSDGEGPGGNGPSAREQSLLALLMGLGDISLADLSALAAQAGLLLTSTTPTPAPAAAMAPPRPAPPLPRAPHAALAAPPQFADRPAPESPALFALDLSSGSGAGAGAREGRQQRVAWGLLAPDSRTPPQLSPRLREDPVASLLAANEGTIRAEAVGLLERRSPTHPSAAAVGAQRPPHRGPTPAVIPLGNPRQDDAEEHDNTERLLETVAALNAASAQQVGSLFENLEALRLLPAEARALAELLAPARAQQARSQHPQHPQQPRQTQHNQQDQQDQRPQRTQQQYAGSHQPWMQQAAPLAPWEEGPAAPADDYYASPRLDRHSAPQPSAGRRPLSPLGPPADAFALRRARSENDQIQDLDLDQRMHDSLLAADLDSAVCQALGLDLRRLSQPPPVRGGGATESYHTTHHAPVRQQQGWGQQQRYEQELPVAMRGQPAADRKRSLLTRGDAPGHSVEGPVGRRARLSWDLPASTLRANGGGGGEHAVGAGLSDEVAAAAAALVRRYAADRAADLPAVSEAAAAAAAAVAAGRLAAPDRGGRGDRSLDARRPGGGSWGGGGHAADAEAQAWTSCMSADGILGSGGARAQQALSTLLGWDGNLTEPGMPTERAFSGRPFAAGGGGGGRIPDVRALSGEAPAGGVEHPYAAGPPNMIRGPGGPARNPQQGGVGRDANAQHPPRSVQHHQQQGAGAPTQRHLPPRPRPTTGSLPPGTHKPSAGYFGLRSAPPGQAARAAMTTTLGPAAEAVRGLAQSAGVRFAPQQQEAGGRGLGHETGAAGGGGPLRAEEALRLLGLMGLLQG
ncbi:hypothetical protein HYH03_014647 [Edaphochlamys debaryana]|uniref:AP2/ERF domain-containing protein n=1 Tax=Edaphochlamys debaryana TaxID=47281 RepID=A0A835XND6_9CHLO|nr:hypothetical protein HYH03_014647 [Edaphochlamys debaryana]|eukprot:KAG2486719.1 hypothetical protein HYH03_014647 [Edaphochlamys debaryana]